MTELKNVYIKISNKKEIDINAFRLLGASTKRGDKTKIGYFGSGLKYAIAVLIRDKVKLKVYSGSDEIKINTVKKKFGDKNFDVIKFNNQLSSLTTDMGVDWKTWFAIREIYCNALDEGSCKVDVANKMKAEKGNTIFFIEMNDKIKDVFKNWNNYFSDKRTDIIYEDGKNKVFIGGEKFVMYRKGIKVCEKPVESLFHYDLDEMEINESRTVKSDFDMNWRLVGFLKTSANKEMIIEIYDKFKKKYEGGLAWEYGSSQFNKNWLDVLGGRMIIMEDTAGYFRNEMSDRTIVLPNRLAKELKKCFREKVKIYGYSDRYGEKKILKMNEAQKTVLDFCLDFLKDEIDINKYKVVLADLDSGTLGEAVLDTIFISPRSFDLGKKQVAATLIEEYSHLDSKAGDKTRNFQSYLIKKYIGVIETRKGIYL